MNNGFFKKIIKSFEITAMSALTLSFLAFGPSLTAFADEPEDSLEEIDFSEYAITETYDFEDANTVTFEDYINYQVDLAQEYTIPAYDASSFAGNKLSDVNKKVYNKYKDIAIKIANGDLDNSLCYFTPQELGVDAAYTLSELGCTGFSTKEERNAVADALKKKTGMDQFNLGLVSNVVRTDCPYERYWMGLSSTFSPFSIRYRTNANGETEFYYVGEAVFYIVVNSDYEGNKGFTSVNTAKTKSVKETISRVNGILAEAKTKTDREKIDYYKDQICSLTEYNYGALNLSTDEYGNPWQLVYVFDGNPDSNVVCEGYSKAFQYLCEKTQFSSSLINCYTVTGVFYCDGDGGPHMWNIVHWSDGKNYMVDLTNVDGFAGDKLFMALPESGDIETYYFKVYGETFEYYYDTYIRDIFSDEDLTLGATSGGVNQSNDQVEAFVERFYTQILDRPSEPAGLENWTNALVAGTRGGADVADEFIHSAEFQGKIMSDEEYITKLYHAFFNREPDAPGMASWKADIAAGKGRDFVLNGFLVSDEYNNLCANYGIKRDSTRTFVKRFYKIILGREDSQITAAELDNWQIALDAKAITGSQMAREWINDTPEFQARELTNEEYLNILYNVVLKRDIDPVGLATWSGELNKGRSRADILEELLRSNEFKKMCAEYGINP